jgi:hypothetical protein
MLPLVVMTYDCLDAKLPSTAPTQSADQLGVSPWTTTDNDRYGIEAPGGSSHFRMATVIEGRTQHDERA